MLCRDSRVKRAGGYLDMPSTMLNPSDGSGSTLRRLFNAAGQDSGESEKDYGVGRGDRGARRKQSWIEYRAIYLILD
jgi:hypothetical protein